MNTENRDYKGYLVVIYTYPFITTLYLPPTKTKFIPKRDKKGNIRDDIIQGGMIFNGTVLYKRATKEWRVPTGLMPYIYMGSDAELIEAVARGASPKEACPVYEHLVHSFEHVPAAIDSGKKCFVYRDGNKFIAWIVVNPIDDDALFVQWDAVKPGLDPVVEHVFNGCKGVLASMSR